MTIAIFITSESDAACLIPWGVRFAHADHTELLIVCPRKSKGKRGWDPLTTNEKSDNPLFTAVFDVLDQQDPQRIVLKEHIGEGAESSDLDRVAIETRELVAPQPEEAFVEEIANLDVWTLLLPARQPAKAASQDNMSWTQKLFLGAPCQVAIVRGLPPDSEAPMNVVVACQGDRSPDDRLAIKNACQLASDSENGSVTLLYVRPDDDLVARQVGEKHTQQLVKHVSDKDLKIETRVELADSFCEGIKRLPLNEFDVILAGTRHQKTIRALFRGIEQKEDEPKVAIIAVREAVPLSDRMWSRFKNAVRSKIPQLDREQRVSVVDRLQEGSLFNFDFMALISLSTLIAAMGLAKDSGAVVIGAMLVAPLMTPLVAMGFALVQGNERLIRSAMKSVLLGFTMALLIGALAGVFIRLIEGHGFVTPEMNSRGVLNVLDIVIALASGVAGAYAMGRPNLNSAIPGVAIAAALVPPIATSGLALAMGDFELLGLASLLFFTNLVCIVLGTAITFWCVGISTRVGGDRPAQVWPRYCFMAFVIISFVLAAYMSFTYKLDPSHV